MTLIATWSQVTADPRKEEIMAVERFKPKEELKQLQGFQNMWRCGWLEYQEKIVATARHNGEEEEKHGLVLLQARSGDVKREYLKNLWGKRVEVKDELSLMGLEWKQGGRRKWN